MYSFVNACYTNEKKQQHLLTNKLISFEKKLVLYFQKFRIFNIVFDNFYTL